MDSNAQKQVDEMTRQAAEGLYNLAATMESHRRGEAEVIYRWQFGSLTPEQQAPWLNDAMFVAKDHPVEGVTP